MAVVALHTPLENIHCPGDVENRLLEILQHGLPLVSRPYALIADQLGITEDRVIEMINGLIDNELIKRYGIVVRHHEAGYRANAMIVWDVPDDKLDSIPQQMKLFPFVTLCYRRPRRLPDWPYNVFCMIHGHERSKVMQNIEEMITTCGWHDIQHAVLFSKRRFKQRGARYITKHEHDKFKV